MSGQVPTSAVDALDAQPAQPLQLADVGADLAAGAMDAVRQLAQAESSSALPREAVDLSPEHFPRPVDGVLAQTSLGR